ncbi:hypothetical protein [Streptomyces sp. NPDC001275]
MPGRVFVNTASFGAYAEIVQRPEYRNAKAATALAELPDLLTGCTGARLTAQAEGTRSALTTHLGEQGASLLMLIAKSR